MLELARRRVAPIEQHFDQIVAADPELPRSQALAQALTQGGYAASVRQGPVGEQLCQQHCPVAHVAHEFPQLCEAETEVFSRVLGSHVQRLATIAHGDGVCTTCIPSTPAPDAPAASTGAPSTPAASTPRASAPHERVPS